LQNLSSQADVRQTVAHIAHACRLEDRLYIRAQCPIDSIYQLKQIERLAASNIDRATDRPRCIGRQQIPLDDIIDVREIARLLAIAKNCRTTPVENLGNKFRNHGRILALRILPRTEHIEVSKRY